MVNGGLLLLLVVGRMGEGRRREDEVESWTGVEADDNVIRDARWEVSWNRSEVNE